MISALNRPQRSSGNKARHLRHVYLISKTPYKGVIHIPILSIHFLTPSIDFTEYEGIIVTSKQAISALNNYSIDWSGLKCIAVSESTALFAKKAGAIEVEIAKGYGESIPNVLKAKERNGKWLYLRPKVVASEWVETARSFGIVMDEAIVYETICNDNVSNRTIDENGVLIFTSPSSIHCFTQIYTILPTHKIIAIGKTTQSALPSNIESHVSPTASVASAVDLAYQIAIEK